MRQRTDLNRSDQPAYRGQDVGVRPESDYAGVGDLGGLTDRVGTLEGQVADLLSRMSAAEAAIADHEDRIVALEP